MDSHGRFQQADPNTVCPHCHQPKGHIKGHPSVCKHNPKNKDKEVLICPQCDASYKSKKHLNYHVKYRCKKRPNQDITCSAEAKRAEAKKKK